MEHFALFNCSVFTFASIKVTSKQTNNKKMATTHMHRETEDRDNNQTYGMIYLVHFYAIIAFKIKAVDGSVFINS